MNSEPSCQLIKEENRSSSDATTNPKAASEEVCGRAVNLGLPSQRERQGETSCQILFGLIRQLRERREQAMTCRLRSAMCEGKWRAQKHTEQRYDTETMTMMCVEVCHIEFSKNREMNHGAHREHGEKNSKKQEFCL